MSLAQSNTLGLCLSGNQVFYAVSPPGQQASVLRIGQIQFQFDTTEASESGGPEFSALVGAVQRVVADYRCSQVRVVSPPQWEVWTALPKSAYEDPLERDPLLAILGERFPKANREPIWFSVSNRELRMLVIRSAEHTETLAGLVKPAPVNDRLSVFECGIRWAAKTKSKGTFLTLHYHEGLLSAASFILGKLRGATYFPFAANADLAYHWLHHAQHLHWMRGIHDLVLVSGAQAAERTNRIKPFLDPGSSIVVMDSPEAMHIETGDQTYGFDVSEAWPAVLASLEL